MYEITQQRGEKVRELQNYNNTRFPSFAKFAQFARAFRVVHFSLAVILFLKLTHMCIITVLLYRAQNKIKFK